MFLFIEYRLKGEKKETMVHLEQGLEKKQQKTPTALFCSSRFAIMMHFFSVNFSINRFCFYASHLLRLLPSVERSQCHRSVGVKQVVVWVQGHRYRISPQGLYRIPRLIKQRDKKNATPKNKIVTNEKKSPGPFLGVKSFFEIFFF